LISLVAKSKGASAPFLFWTGVARMRDNGLLERALAAFKTGYWADALLDVESVCRRQPALVVPATLRAKLLQHIQPSLAAKSWYAAWCRDPQDPNLQDAMLDAFLSCNALETVRVLGTTFLPARLQTEGYGSLIGLLRSAQASWAGACWKDGNNLQGRVFDFSTGASKTAQLLITDGGLHQHTAKVPTDGVLFSIPFPCPTGVWSVALEPLTGRLSPGVLAGSPLSLGDVAPDLAEATVLRSKRPNPRGVHIIIPVYRDRQKVQTCIESVLATAPLNRTPMRVTVIDDATPDPDLKVWLDDLPVSDRLVVLRNAYNLGFIETCNRGLRLHTALDALLLNADAMVHGNWLDRMHAALYAHADVASVTPWSNNGEISSFPTIGKAAPAPNAAQLAEIDDTVAALFKSGRVQDADIPSGCGFALLMRRSVLNQIGLLDGVALNRGYSEEVDWCLRATGTGYRHRLAAGVFVAHAGTASFGYEKALRVAQNRAVIQVRYPEFYARYYEFVRKDSLAASRISLTQALQSACPSWLADASTSRPGAPIWPIALPPPLPTASERIAVWADRLSLANARKILALARLLASRPAGAPRLRLLVLGDAVEALLRTGVVDVLPPVAARDAGLLSDMVLVGRCGCTCVLSEDMNMSTGAIKHVHMGSAFDPKTWLMQWESALSLAA
jgi:GT2 family glycosyltransferase